MVGAVVDGEAVVLGIKREVAFADAVAVAPDERRQKRFRTVDDSLDCVVSLDDISNPAVAVWNHDGDECAAVVSDADFVAALVDECEQICLFSLDSGLKIFTFQS